ncbi:sensor histidine kinase [Xylanimonas oleitrophica]|nr:ATP-binding protein [Xylanimonas oleitrophica]
MLRRLGVRGKILATLAVPVLVLLLGAAWISWGSYQDARRAEQTSQLVRSLELQDRAGTAFAQERALSIAMSLGITGARSQLNVAQAETDEALRERNAALAELDTSALDPRVGQAVRRTMLDVGSVDLLQKQVLDGSITEGEATQKYNAFIQNALEVPRILAETTLDRDLAPRIEAYIALDEVLLSNTEERPVVAAALQRAATGQEITPALAQRLSTVIRQTDQLHTDAGTALDRIPGRHLVPTFSGHFGQIRSAVLANDFGRIDPEVAQGWGDLSSDWVDRANVSRDEVRQETGAFAQRLADDARQQTFLTAGSVFGVVILSLLFAIFIARRIVMPLRRLTAATAEVRQRLPRMVEQMAVPGQEPSVDLIQIPVESRDEIGRLASAFNDVNVTTMEVAREQAALRGSIAEMFVNVARRDQVLLNRQLAFLDELERSEEDPSTLSNLFRLDHLATRMRRNAESLLVLAGIDSGRRVRQPMPVSDVIRTASSEIELYDRVRLDLTVDPMMLGHNALNAAHLLAELLENATMFSEPHTPVEVSTNRDQRGVVVTVRDHGLGMAPDEIAEANRKVASRSAQDAVGAQRLGLYVVGRLADRLGAVITFDNGPDGTGTVVTVVFPSQLFLPDEAVPLPQPTDPLEASTQREVASLGHGGPSVTGPHTATVPVAGAFGQHPELPSLAETGAPYAPSPAYETPAYEQPAARAAAPLVEPEPPVAVPVDLDALTDGTTATGMPRRRTARPEPEDTGAVVLPPIETPELPTNLTLDDSWTPPSDVEASGRSLPSRQRSAQQADSLPEPAPVSAPVLAVDQRTGLFSSFRSLSGIEPDPAETGSLHLEGSGDDPAALPEPLTAPQVAVAETPAPAPVRPAPEPQRHSQEQQAHEHRAHEHRAPEQRAPEQRVEAFRPQEQYAPEQQAPTNPFSPVRAPEEPAAEAQPAAAGAPTAGDGLPAFEELMADLPSRRSPRDSQGARKRGLFGRRPEDSPATTAFPAQQSEASEGPFAPVSEPTPAPVAAVPAAPARASVLNQQQPAPQASVAAPAQPSPVPAPAIPQPQHDSVPYTPAPAAFEPAGTPAGTRTTTSSSRGGSALPLRSASTDAVADPLDPQYVPDTVEARSEWMASAVLYEEMSSLLRRGVFEEESVTPTNDDTYRPLAVAPAEGHGLVRRTSRAAERVSPADRFTARIERDPEQLRSRLSAFQSATARGRAEGDGDGGSTWAPRTVNDGDRSAPQTH